MATYTTRANIEQYLNADLSAVDGFVTIVIEAVSNFIDRYCNKQFSANAETRYYDGCGETELKIDSFYGSPTVKILYTDGTEMQTLTEGADGDYVTTPYNTTEKNTLQLTPVNSIGMFPSWKRSVKVTANFGIASTAPKDVILVATMLSAKHLEKRTKGGVASQESLGDYSVSFKDIDENADLLGVKAMLDQHVDIPI